MKAELQTELRKRFPFLNPPPKKGRKIILPMDYGIAVGDGWYRLLDDLCANIEDELEKEPKAKNGFGVDQIKEKFGCYDPETEVLTSVGWKHFSDVTMGDELASLTADGGLIYERPTDIISYYYEGPMYRLVTRGVDLFVTPNHNLYVSKATYYNGRYHPPVKREYPFGFKTPLEVRGTRLRFQKGAVWKGTPIDEFTVPGTQNIRTTKKDSLGRSYQRIYTKPPLILKIDAFLTFLGWYVAEGWTDGKCQITMCFNYKDETEKNEVRKAIADLGFEPHERKGNDAFNVYNSRLAQWLLANCGHLAPNKKTPPFIKNLTPDQIVKYLTALFKGDGHKSQTANLLTTTSTALVDDVQELLLKAGSVSSVCPRPPSKKVGKVGKYKVQSKHISYNINWLKGTFYHNTPMPCKFGPRYKEEWESYKGMVYCATVPRNLLFVRRDWKPIWCGNSLRFYVHGESGSIRSAIFQASEKSSHICESCGAVGSLRDIQGWYKTFCQKCYRSVLKDRRRMKAESVADSLGASGKARDDLSRRILETSERGGKP